MAQIDHSIYLQQQGPDFGKAFEGFERGMRLGDMMKQNKIRDLELQKQSAIDDAFKAGQVQNPDGSVSFDKSITLKQLMGVDPREAQKAEMQFQQQDIMKQKNHANILFQESIKSLQNPAYYSTAVDTLIQNGVIKPGEAPPTFDESFVKMAAARAGDAKDYLDNLRKEQESQARLAETKMNNDFRREELGLRRLERNEAMQTKAAEKARPSDKQIESFTELDTAESDLTNILAQLGNKSDWVGPVDGNVPKFLIGEDQAAWRSAVGKYKDAYRKAITGAGAGPSEIAILESRLPSETDPINNFIAKANEAKKQLYRYRDIMATNLENGGKNVKEFKKEYKEETKKDVNSQLNELSDKQIEELYYKNGGQ